MDVTSIASAIVEKYRANLSMSKSKKSVHFYGQKLYSKTLITLLPSADELHSAGLYHCDMLYHEILEKIKDKLLDEKPKDLDPQLGAYQIGCDVLSGEHYVIENGGILPYNFQAWKATIPEEQYEILYSMRTHMVAGFNPHKGLSWEDEVITTIGPQKFPHYNLFIPAPWSRIDPPTDFSIVEQDIPDFLEHFVPDPRERDYMLWWLYKLTHSRCQDLLVLIGTQGNGKNTFMQLASIIAGEHNAMGAAKSFGKEKFNSEVRRRKLLCLDEYSLSIEHKDAIKCWCNNKITVEVKGGDPQAMENHCSFILAHNRDKSCSLEFKDRRFTAPRLAAKDLFFVWDAKRVERLAKTIEENEEFKLAFPHWVIKTVQEKGISFPLSRCLVTERFYELVETAKPRWFKVFKKKLLANDIVTAQDVYKATRMRIDDDTINERLIDECEEREMRDIKPHVIAKQFVDTDGTVAYESCIQVKQEAANE